MALPPNPELSAARKTTRASYVRNFIFGVEDSLVSTVGLLSGIAAAEVGQSAIVISGIVLIFVEAFSMAVGSSLSEHMVEEYETGREASVTAQFKSGVVMLFSYFLAGLVPLSPYILLEGATAFWISITLSLAALFILGAFGGRIAKTSVRRNGFEMLIVGGSAVLLGVIVGKLLN